MVWLKMLNCPESGGFPETPLYTESNPRDNTVNYRPVRSWQAHPQNAVCPTGKSIKFGVTQRISVRLFICLNSVCAFSNCYHARSLKYKLYTYIFKTFSHEMKAFARRHLLEFQMMMR